MTMLYSSKEWSISLTVFNIRIELEILYHVLHNFNISSCNSKMKSYFTFGLFKLIQQLFKRNILRVDSLLFIINFLFEIDEIKFKLSNLKSSNSINDIFESSSNFLIFFKIFTIHFYLLL